MTIVAIIGWLVLALIAGIALLGVIGWWCHVRDLAELYRDSE